MAKATMTSENIKIDISLWDLEAVSEFAVNLEKVILEAASEALNIAAKKYPADIMFPVAWDSPESPEDRAKDPTLIRITLPLSDESKDMPSWYVSLADMVEETFDLHRHGDGIEYYSEGLARLRDAFATLAARIDEVIKAGDSK